MNKRLGAEGMSTQGGSRALSQNLFYNGHRLSAYMILEYKLVPALHTALNLLSRPPYGEKLGYIKF